MAAILTDKVNPICPSDSAQVVRLVREVADSLNRSGIVLPAGETLVAHVASRFKVALSAAQSGFILLMVQLVEITDEDVARMRTDCRLALHFVPYGQEFRSITEMLSKTLNAEIGSRNDVHFDNQATLIALLALDNSDESQGQLSHPARLSDQIEEVAQICASIESDEHVRFLMVLESACRDALDAGAAFAAVAIRREVASGDVQYRYDPFYADSEEHYRAQELQRRGSGRCVSLRVIHQDLPR